MAIYSHVAIRPNSARLKPGRIPPYDVMVKRAIQDLRFKCGSSPKQIIRHILKNNLMAKKYTVIKHLPKCLKRMIRAKVIKKTKDRRYKLTAKGRCIIKFCKGERWKRPYSTSPSKLKPKKKKSKKDKCKPKKKKPKKNKCKPKKKKVKKNKCKPKKKVKKNKCKPKKKPKKC